MRGLRLVIAAALLMPGGAAQSQTAPKEALKPAATKEPLKAPLKDLPTPYTPGFIGARPAASPREPDVAFGAYQRGQYATAFREATQRIASNSKDAAAMTLLGELYNQGLGIRQDAVKAAEWYRLAAAQGDPHAMAALGLMAIDGRGGPKDAKAGRRWLEQASDKGDPTASYNLALIVLSSEGDQAKAAALFRKAADGEIAAAQHNLGVMYLQGRGVAKDPAKAAEWFRRAADNGDLAGEVEFAIQLFNGNGVTKDEVRAARYFQHAASRGNAIAQNRLARLYAIGRGVPKNLVEAAAWNLAAAGQGLTDAWLDQNVAGLNADERKRAELLATERTEGQ